MSALALSLTTRATAVNHLRSHASLIPATGAEGRSGRPASRLLGLAQGQGLDDY